jgi:hypothetical protein
LCDSPTEASEKHEVQSRTCTPAQNKTANKKISTFFILNNLSVRFEERDIERERNKQMKIERGNVIENWISSKLQGGLLYANNHSQGLVPFVVAMESMRAVVKEETLPSGPPNSNKQNNTTTKQNKTKQNKKG